MQALEVKSFLEGKLPETTVEVEGEGCNFQLNVISDELAALSPVKRQQQIYAHLNPWINFSAARPGPSAPEPPRRRDSYG